MSRFFVLLLCIASSTHAAGTYSTNHLTDKIAKNLSYLQDSATASLVVKSSLGSPITWDIGYFTTSDVGTTRIVNRDTASFDWNQMEAYLLGDVQFVETIDGGNIYVSKQWTFPIPGYPLFGRTGLVDLRFKLQSYVLELYQGQYQGYIAGIYQARFIMGPQGDYSSSWVVDAADYVLWRDTIGQTGPNPAADGDFDYDIDSADYDVWRSHFGNTYNALSSVGTPEPCTMILLAIAVSLPIRIRN